MASAPHTTASARLSPRETGSCPEGGPADGEEPAPPPPRPLGSARLGGRPGRAGWQRPLLWLRGSPRCCRRSAHTCRERAAEFNCVWGVSRVCLKAETRSLARRAWKPAAPGGRMGPGPRAAERALGPAQCDIRGRPVALILLSLRSHVLIVSETATWDFILITERVGGRVLPLSSSLFLNRVEISRKKLDCVKVKGVRGTRARLPREKVTRGLGSPEMGAGSCGRCEAKIRDPQSVGRTGQPLRERPGPRPPPGTGRARPAGPGRVTSRARSPRSRHRGPRSAGLTGSSPQSPAVANSLGRTQRGGFWGPEGDPSSAAPQGQGPLRHLPGRWGFSSHRGNPGGEGRGSGEERAVSGGLSLSAALSLCLSRCLSVSFCLSLCFSVSL